MSNNFITVHPFLVVGFQERKETFLGRLPYVVHKDKKGKVSKEKSLESWRSKDIDLQEFENVPTKGFVFNKGVKRLGEYMASGRSMARVYDPRGFEFEISMDNIVEILRSAVIDHGEIDVPCVYGWHGGELVLLPTNSKAYEEAVQFTADKQKNMSVKDLVRGVVYKHKNATDELIYLGKYSVAKKLNGKIGNHHVFSKVNSGEIKFDIHGSLILNMETAPHHLADSVISWFESSIYFAKDIKVSIVDAPFEKIKTDSLIRIDNEPNRYYQVSRTREPLKMCGYAIKLENLNLGNLIEYRCFDAFASLAGNRLIPVMVEFSFSNFQSIQFLSLRSLRIKIDELLIAPH